MLLHRLEEVGHRLEFVAFIDPVGLEKVFECRDQSRHLRDHHIDIGENSAAAGSASVITSVSVDCERRLA